MPKKNTGLVKYVSPVLLMLLALVIAFLSTINFCVGCTGWSALNPICLLGYVSCLGFIGTLHIVMRIGGVVLFVVGLVKLIKIK